MLLVPLVFQCLRWPAAQERKASSGSMLVTLRDRSLVLLHVISFAANFSFYIVIVWGTAFLFGERGYSLEMAGLYIALVNLVSFPAGLFNGLLSDRVGRRRLTMRRLTMLLYLAACVVVAVLAGFPNQVVILIAIVGFGLTGKWGSDSVINAWVGDHLAAKFPTMASAVFGFNNTARVLGTLTGPLVAGALLDVTGTLSTGLFVASAVLGGAALLAPFVGEQRDRR
jgi:MFS family permease